MGYTCSRAHTAWFREDLERLFAFLQSGANGPRRKGRVLGSLSGELLKDIGITRAEVQLEASERFRST
jgi:hypothetical protein